MMMKTTQNIEEYSFIEQKNVGFFFVVFFLVVKIVTVERKRILSSLFFFSRAISLFVFRA